MCLRRPLALRTLRSEDKRQREDITSGRPRDKLYLL
jgi:hypothetical protein